jgi:hypothetical protein
LGISIYLVIKTKKVAKSLIGLPYMPARTLNDFFAGFFYAGIRARQEVTMVKTGKGQGNDGVKVIKVEAGREKEKEVIVRQEVVSSKWKRWNHDNFSRDWNKAYFTKVSK